MATEEASLETIVDKRTNALDLEKLVQNATWKELLVSLVDTNALDPWNIDLGKIVEGYVEAVRRMKVLDLHVPANIILAASVLLRIKSEAVVISSWEEPLQDVEADGVHMERILPSVPELISNLRLQPHKKITLQELMDALDEAVQIKEDREQLFTASNETMQFFIDQNDIDQKSDRIFEMVKQNLDKTGMVTFTELSRPFASGQEVLVELFIPLIFLSHNERINIMQEKFFDEIIVSLNNGHVNG